MTLDSIVVEGHRYNSAIRERADGSLTWDMRLMDDLPKLLGAADPIHYMQMLPAFRRTPSTTAEYTYKGRKARTTTSLWAVSPCTT